MTGCGLKEAIRRSGLTRRQLRYLEERGHLGFVARSDGRTVYGSEQLELIDRIARLRGLGARIDEAAQLARELAGDAEGIPLERIEALLETALASVERNSRVARDLAALSQRRWARRAG